MGRADRNSPDTWRFPWELTLKNRYSKRLVSVQYYDNEKEARSEAKSQKGTDYIVKVRNVHPIARLY